MAHQLARFQYRDLHGDQFRRPLLPLQLVRQRRSQVRVVGNRLHESTVHVQPAPFNEMQPQAQTTAARHLPAQIGQTGLQFRQCRLQRLTEVRGGRFEIYL